MAGEACKGKINQGIDIDYPHKDMGTGIHGVHGPKFGFLKSKPR